MEEKRIGWTPLARSRARAEVASPPLESEAPPEPQVAVIEHGCALEGKLETDRPIRIEGELRGFVVSSESVTIAETGTVEGNVEARSVEIRGAVVGDVTGTREVLLHAGGKLHGDVDTASLVVARGAYFNGRTKMRLPQRTSREVTQPATV